MRLDLIVCFYTIFGTSPSGKAPGFDPGIRRFDPYRPSHYFAMDAIMKFLVKSLLYVPFVLLLLIFVLNNSHSVDINFFGITYLHVPLVVLMLVLLLFGFMCGFLVSVKKIFVLKSQIKNGVNKFLKP